MIAAAEELAPVLGTKGACEILGVSRATLYRRRNPPVAGPGESRHWLSSSCFKGFMPIHYAYRTWPRLPSSPRLAPERDRPTNC